MQDYLNRELIGQLKLLHMTTSLQALYNRNSEKRKVVPAGVLSPVDSSIHSSRRKPKRETLDRLGKFAVMDHASFPQKATTISDAWSLGMEWMSLCD